MRPLTITEQAENIASSIEFDYVTWILAALGQKSGESGLSAQTHLSQQSQVQAVERYFDLVNQVNQLDSQIQQIYADRSL